ncbi:hypothetical protein K438DRAFT_2007805 [Mycena galopus ATCC 62051]|nr:hypothetical protein K438DRAFT_2007805 [Mycena galopus ATCC 62051]
MHKFAPELLDDVIQQLDRPDEESFMAVLPMMKSLPNVLRLLHRVERFSVEGLVLALSSSTPMSPYWEVIQLPTPKNEAVFAANAFYWPRRSAPPSHTSTGGSSRPPSARAISVPPLLAIRTLTLQFDLTGCVARGYWPQLTQTGLNVATSNPAVERLNITICNSRLVRLPLLSPGCLSTQEVIPYYSPIYGAHAAD